MATLHFPFWIVFNGPEDLRGADIPRHSRKVTVFTTADKLITFLSSVMGQRWEIEYIDSRDNLLMAVADLHSYGVGELCIDPGPDGCDGSTASLSDMLRELHTV
jgi:hypothetical protein